MIILIFGVLLVICGWVLIDSILKKKWGDIILSVIAICLAAFPLIVYPFMEEYQNEKIEKCIEKEGVYLRIDDQFKCVQDIVIIELD